MSVHHESQFETELCDYLAAHGWLYSADDAGYDRARTLFPEDVMAWLAETQRDELAKVASTEVLLDRIVKMLDGPLDTTGGTLNLLRRGFQTGAASFTMAQPRPETSLNPETTKRYAANWVRVMRQVRYSPHNGNCLDLVFFVNGLPVATVELKTDFTHAFSGSVSDPDSGPDDFTEASMNPGLTGRGLPKAFAGADFNVMIVANTFQTGFDQPLLVAMYVDKRLDGVTAVQTLSRLNRTAPGKETTYVVDFVNDPDDIVAAFKPYYEQATLSATTDPDLIHDLRTKLDATHIYTDDEVDAVAVAWVTDGGARGVHERLQGLLSAPRVRFTAALDHAIAQGDSSELERLELFRRDVDSYVKLYDFLSQIVDYGQTDLEKRSIFFRLLARLIRDETRHESIDLSDVVLSGVAHRAGATLGLDLGGEHVLLDPLTGLGSGAAQDPVLVALAEVIRKMNEVFDGGSFDDTDIAALSTHVVRRMLDNPVVRAQVDANTQQQVSDSPAPKSDFTDALVEAQAAYGELVKQLFDGESKRADYFHSLITLLYREAARGDEVSTGSAS